MFDPEDLDPVTASYHEAGHVLMAHLLGGRVVGASIEPDEDELMGQTAVEWSGVDALERARRSAMVALAGPVAEAWLLFGVVEHRLGRRRRAERLLRRALRHDEGCSDAHNRLGALLLEDGRDADAYVHLRRAQELAPEDPATLIHLAQAAARVGRPEEAKQHLQAAARHGAPAQTVSAVLRKIEAA